jgi:hypothetical protein
MSAGGAEGAVCVGEHAAFDAATLAAPRGKGVNLRMASGKGGSDKCLSAVRGAPNARKVVYAACDALEPRQLWALDYDNSVYVSLFHADANLCLSTAKDARSHVDAFALGPLLGGFRSALRVAARAILARRFFASGGGERGGVVVLEAELLFARGAGGILVQRLAGGDGAQLGVHRLFLRRHFGHFAVEIGAGLVGEAAAELLAQHAGGHGFDFALGEVAELERAVADADEAVDLQAQGAEDVLDLAVLAFAQAEHHPGVGALGAFKLGVDRAILHAIDRLLPNAATEPDLELVHSQSPPTGGEEVTQLVDHNHQVKHHQDQQEHSEKFECRNKKRDKHEV